jgi:ABC-type lipoprotein release transport system permease subunit
MSESNEDKTAGTTNGESSDVFNGTLAANGQVTISKRVRETLNIEQGDIVFLRILKVISADGHTKHDVTELPVEAIRQ